MHAKSFLSILLIAIAFSALDAKKIENFYTSYQSDRGMIYFVHPTSLKPVAKTTAIKSAMKCDYTYVSSTDSVRVLMTINIADLIKPDSLIVEVEDSVMYKTSLSLLYSDPHKDKFTYRLEASIPYNCWSKMYKADIPYRFLVTTVSGKNYAYQYNRKEWITFKGLFNQLFKVIDVSR